MKNFDITKIENYLASGQFAVVLLTISIFYFSVATFVESIYSTSFARALFYQSWGMALLAGLAVTSIYFAILKRFSLKPKDIAFQIMHWGILIIFAGAFFSYFAGIDGTITLYPHEVNNRVQLQQKEIVLKPLKAELPTLRLDLPLVAFSHHIDQNLGGILFGNYIPFAEEQLVWLDSLGTSSSYFELSQDGDLVAPLVFTHSQLSQFRHEAQVGPLKIYFLPLSFAEYFKNEIWTDRESCFDVTLQTPIARSVGELEQGRRSCFDHKTLSSSPVVMIFGDQLYLYNKSEKKLFLYHQFSNGATSLPWMGLTLSLKKFVHDSYPDLMPVAVLPKSLKEGLFSAVEMNFGKEKFWLSDSKAEEVSLKGNIYLAQLGQKSFTLPINLKLVQFEMTKESDGSPASYASRLLVYGQEGDLEHRVSMNQPLKIGDFNLYQSSYFEIEKGKFASVLTASYDPGRPYKYLGSFLLIVGAFLYYLWAIRLTGEFKND